MKDVLAALRARARTMEWERDAVCKQVGTQPFYPEKGDDFRSPVALCLTCPVIAECRAVALETREKYGVWGGLTEGKRRRASRSADAEDQSLLQALQVARSLQLEEPLIKVGRRDAA